MKNVVSSGSLFSSVLFYGVISRLLKLFVVVVVVAVVDLILEVLNVSLISIVLDVAVSCLISGTN